jgi:hypothetical protein
MHLLSNVLAGRSVSSNSLSGSIPPSIGNLDQLTELYVPLPLVAAAVALFSYLFLYFASLLLSASLLLLVHSVRDLSNNGFNGNVPAAVGLLENLYILYPLLFPSIFRHGFISNLPHH